MPTTLPWWVYSTPAMPATYTPWVYHGGTLHPGPAHPAAHGGTVSGNEALGSRKEVYHGWETSAHRLSPKVWWKRGNSAQNPLLLPCQKWERLDSDRVSSHWFPLVYPRVRVVLPVLVLPGSSDRWGLCAGRWCADRCSYVTGMWITVRLAGIAHGTVTLLFGVINDAQTVLCACTSECDKCVKRFLK